jgi:hypothetical protein
VRREGGGVVEVLRVYLTLVTFATWEYLSGGGWCWPGHVVSLHTQRCDKQRWQGTWKSQYAKERILSWVRCICLWHARDLQIPTWTETNTRRILQIHKNTCNQSHRMSATNWWLLHHCILLLLHSFDQSATLRMPYYRQHWIISFGTHLLARFCRSHLLVQWVYHQHRIAVLMFKNTSTAAILPSRVNRVSICSLLHRSVGIYINKTTSSS